MSWPRPQPPSAPFGREHDGRGHRAEAQLVGELEMPQRRAHARRHVVAAASQRRRYASVPASQSWRGGLNTSTSRVSSSAKRAVRQVRRNHQHFARAHDDLTLPVRAQQKLQRALEDVCDLLVLVRVPRHVVALLEIYVRDHHALARDQPPREAALQRLERQFRPSDNAWPWSACGTAGCIAARIHVRIPRISGIDHRFAGRARPHGDSSRSRGR